MYIFNDIYQLSFCSLSPPSSYWDYSYFSTFISSFFSTTYSFLLYGVAICEVIWIFYICSYYCSFAYDFGVYSLSNTSSLKSSFFYALRLERTLGLNTVLNPPPCWNKSGSDWSLDILAGLYIINPILSDCFKLIPPVASGALIILTTVLLP